MDTYFSSFFKSITSESMGCGHPDKVADAISDAILDACLARTRNFRNSASFSLPASSIINADALMKSAFSIIREYHPSAYLLLRSREKWQKVHHFKRFGVFTLASALIMLYISVSGLGAGLSASRRAWERVSLHESLETQK